MTVSPVKEGGTPKLVQSFTYDGYRNLETRTDSRGKTTTYNHDKRNNLTSIEYPDTNYTMTFGYDKDDRLIERVVPVKPGETRTETITRDDRGNVTSVQYEVDGSTTATRSTEYDKSERIEKVTDEDGREVEYEYNDRGYVEKVTFAPGKDEEACHVYFYDHEGRVTTFRDGLGNDWKTEYDGHGRVYKRTDPSGNYIVYSYWDGDDTGDGTLIKESKQYASGGSSGNEFRWTKYEYDHLLRTEKIEELAKDGPGGTNLGDGWQTTTYEYDLVGRATKILDELNKYTEFSYDDLGRLESREHQTGNKVVFAYDQQTGLVSTQTVTEIVPGPSTNTRVQTFSYDDLGRPILQTDELGNPSTITYNFAGQVLTYKDQLANLVTHSYDRRGARIATVVQESNLTTVQAVSFSHYSSGLLKEATDGTGKKTKYTYDERARLVEREFLPDNTKYVWVYDEENLTTLTDPRGTVFSYTYDDRGLVTTIAYTGSFSDTGPVKYQYNAVGETTCVEDGDSKVELARNTLGQVKSETQYLSAEAVSNDFGRVMTSTFDAAGRRTTLQYPTIGDTAFNLAYQYDSLYRLTTLQSTGNTVATYAYAGFDRMTQATYGNGTRMLLTHDNRGLVTTVRHETSTSSPIFEINRLIDPAGRTTWRQLQYFNPTSPSTIYHSDVARYVYDAASRMHCAFHGVSSPGWGALAWNSTPTAAASKKMYAFTAADTRDEVTAIYYPYSPVTEGYSDNTDTHDYVSATIDTITHTMGNDASGNRTTHHQSGTGVSSNGYYAYDAFDRLVFAETDSYGGSATTIEWRHDGLGRTIEERVTNGSGTTITRYYHDGDSRVIEVTVPNDGAYNDETKVRSYIFGADGPAPVFGRKWGESSNTDAYFHIDERGSVLGLTKNDQTVLEHYRYQKSFLGITEPRDYGEFTLHSAMSGTAATSTSGLFGNPFLWTGSTMSRGLFDAPGQRLLFVGHGGAYDPVTGVGLQRGGEGAFGGRGHTVPIGTPGDWGGGNPWGSPGGWPGVAGVEIGDRDIHTEANIRGMGSDDDGVSPVPYVGPPGVFPPWSGPEETTHSTSDHTGGLISLALQVAQGRGGAAFVMSELAAAGGIAIGGDTMFTFGDEDLGLLIGPGAPGFSGGLLIVNMKDYTTANPSNDGSPKRQQPKRKWGSSLTWYDLYSIFGYDWRDPLLGSYWLELAALLPIPHLKGVKVAKAIKKAGKTVDKVDDATDVAKGLNKVAQEADDVIHVTPSGVALPAGPKHKIPAGYVEHPSRPGKYGVIEDGKFVEKLRIDQGTPPGKKGPNYSHYHLDGGKQHYSPRPGDKDPGHLGGGG